MTTIDLLQRYPPHKDFTHHGNALDKLEAFNHKKPDPTLPSPDLSQYFDAKTKLLHDMLDRVVKDLANSQSEPVSEYEGTLWRSPLQPRSRSPAYSDISDSFESPGRIEHCTNVLLSTPISPASAQSKGPDGWPLGIEVAMNDFHRGRLSTPVLQQKELPNPMILRKQKQQTPRSGGNGNQEWQETASCENVPCAQQGDGQHRQESGCLKPLAFQKQQNPVIHQKEGERRDHLDGVSFKPLAARQQRYTFLQQQSNCQYQQEGVDLDTPEMQLQSSDDIELDLVGIPTLCARKYGDNQNSRVNASPELHPALADGKLPIGLGLRNASLTPSTFQLHREEHDGSHNQLDDTCLVNKGGTQTALNDSAPRTKKTQQETHHAESQTNALSNALDEEHDSAKALGAFESTDVESIDREFGCQNTFEDSVDDTLQDVELRTSEDSGDDTDRDWKASGPLEDILEESEDPFTSTLTLDQARPQHFTPGSAESLDRHKSSSADERRDSMHALQEPQAEKSTRPSRVLPSLKLAIDPSSTPQLESTKPSMHRPIGTKPSESSLSAAAMAKLSDSARKKGRLSAAALAELRKTAESQPHFQTPPDLPEDQPQAEIHPLLRSKSCSRPSSQPSNVVNDSPLKYVFEDGDSEDHEAEEMDSFSHQINGKPRSLLRPEGPDLESFVKQISTKEYPSQLGKMMEDTVPRYLCNDDDTEAELVGTFTPQKSTLRSSNDTTLVPSLANATPPSTSSSTTSRSSASAVGSPDLMPSFISQPSISPPKTGYYPNSTIGSPAAYNSWASTPHHHKHGKCSSTPSSAATLHTSTVPTPNMSFHGSSPTSLGTTMTPSSSFGNFTSNRTQRRSISASSMFARYHKARYPDLPTAAMTESILTSKEPAEKDKAREITNDPFTSTGDTSTSFSLNLKAPSKEDLPDTLNIGIHQFNTPTKRNPSRFSLHRRSLSTSERPNKNEGLERALSTMIFSPHRSRPHKRSHSISASIDTTAKPDSSCPGNRRSLSIATSTVEQKWEIAPPPTPLVLRDEFSMRYRPGPLEADDHYSPRRDALQGMKQGWKKVFGRK